MSNNITAAPVETHPKINRFLVYAGIISSILLLFSLILHRFQLHLLGLLILNFAYILIGLKFRITPKFMPERSLDILTFIVGMSGALILAYDLIFNVILNYK